MNFLFRLLCIVMLFLHSGILAAEIEDERPPEDLRFIFNIHSDIGYVMTDVEHEEWLRKLRETPDATNRLYDLLWKYVDHRYENEIGGALFALGIRGDLSKEQLKRITDRMRAIVSGPLDKLGLDEQNFIYVGTGMLGNYPSPEHENFALEMLSKNDWSLKMAAARTLGRIGSRKSLEPVRKFYKSQMANVDQKMTDEMIARYGPLKVDCLTEALQNLERRVKTLERKSSRGAGGYQEDFETEGGTANPANSKSPGLQNKSIVAIISGVILSSIAVWRFLKRRRDIDLVKSDSGISSRG